MPRENREHRRRERRNRGDRREQHRGNRSNRNGPAQEESNMAVSPDDFVMEDHDSIRQNRSNNNANNNNAHHNAHNTAAAESASQYTDEDGLSSYYSRELSELQHLCDAASESDPHSWDKIRRWLRNHSAEDARAAAERRGDYETTPLHLACRNCPPLDIVTMLLTASPRTVELADSFGWLPLHYACANEASEEVLVMLAEQYPTSKTSVDKRKRTPLHFALGHTERPANVATVVLLSGTGAALMPDENGMLPLHYACAYGATEQALRVLTDDNIQTITATDNRGRTPLHFALGNADRPASPGVVGLLLSQNPAVVNSVDLEGNLPIHLLATRAQAIKEHEKEKCTNCQECFSLYLDAHPRATADLLTALQSLPDWLRDSAVLSPVVQKILNIKISRRFPTAVTLLDMVFYVIVIAFFQLAVDETVKESSGTPYVAPLFLAALYFTLREIVQALSLLSLGLFSTWVRDLENWMDMVYICLILFWSIVMTTGSLDADPGGFKTGAALSMMVFYFMILSFLQSIYVGFAVFVGGVMYVVKRLAAFLLALLIIIILFSQFFWTLFQMTDECKSGEEEVYPIELYNCTGDPGGIDLECAPNKTVVSCEPDVQEPFCNQWTTIIKIFTMLLGEVDEGYFRDNAFAMLIFALFMFACVIVLANVLIAIVTDSYSVIQNERAGEPGKRQMFSCLFWFPKVFTLTASVYHSVGVLVQ